MINLHFIPRPLPDESPFSLLRRATDANGYNSCLIFLLAKCGTEGIYKSPMLKDSSFGKLLKKNAGEYSLEIESTFYSASKSNKDGSRIEITGISFNTKIIRHKVSAVCTECIREGWERVIKDFLPIENCPYHNRKYLFSCPTCKKNFFWHDKIIDGCSCRAQLESPVCSSEEVELENQFIELLNAKSQDRLDIFTKAYTSLRIRTRPCNKEERRAIFSLALAICKEEIEGVIINLLRVQKIDSINKELAIALLFNITPNSLLTKVHYHLSASPSSIARFRLCSLSEKQLKKYLTPTADEWRIVVSDEKFPKKKKYSKFSSEEVEEICEIHRRARAYLVKLYQRDQKIKDRTFNLPEAANLLGISTREAKFLINSKFLTEPPRLTTQNNSCRILKQSINTFRARHITIIAAAESIKSSIKVLRPLLRRLNIPIIKSSNRPGYRRNDFINRSSLSNLKSSSTAPATPAHRLLSLKLPLCPPAEESNYYTVTDAEKALNLDKTTIRSLARANLLHAPFQNSRHGYLIEKESVHTFKSKYISSAEASEMLLTSPNKTVAILISHDAAPCTGPTTSGERDTYFLRSDMTSKFISSINPKGHHFGHYHRSNLLISPTQAAKILRISLPTLISLKFDIVLPARPKHFRKICLISPPEIEIIRNHIDSLIPISSVISETWLSNRELHYLINDNNKIEKITIDNIAHIRKSDYVRILHFTNNYYTCRAHDSAFNLPPGYTYRLVRFGKLTRAPLPTELSTRSILIQRSTLEVTNE
ncbi:hypothetical protein [Pseudomonas pseudonitroreducens]|uniref:hypothetical protein n=1 Tax=Pseudomonas pseudonitroreducens TaxID=2892326 RepID=UPI001F278D1B|nr:hypothetical protein [Pseudomonas pseudonitroreducens]